MGIRFVGGPHPPNCDHQSAEVDVVPAGAVAFEAQVDVLFDSPFDGSAADAATIGESAGVVASGLECLVNSSAVAMSVAIRNA